MNQELFDTVREFVAEDLNGHFGDAFVFDPILVEPRIDHDGDEYLRIDIIFDGDQQHLDPSWTVGLIRRVRSRLRESGMDASLSPHYNEKSEWEWYQKREERRKSRLAAR